MVMFTELSRWQLPLRGTPCAKCGQPAQRIAVFATGRVVTHEEGGGAPCHLPNPEFEVAPAQPLVVERAPRQAA